MKKISLRCKLGFHDFEVLESAPKWKIVKMIEEKYMNNKDFDKDLIDDDILRIRICVRKGCDKIEDEINDFIKEYIEDRLAGSKRQKVARNIFETRSTKRRN